MIRRGNQKGFTIIDALITLFLIGILIGVVIPKYQQVAHEAQEAALKTGLANIRTSIQLFRMLNGRNPDSLHELMVKDVMLPARIGTDPYTGLVLNQKYLMQQAVDAQGQILDPFGSPFTYDPLQGEAKSATKGYEAW